MDSACSTARATTELDDCEDGIDNDSDGWIDYADPDCQTSDDEVGGFDSAYECNDGSDNEAQPDSLIDADDPHCTSATDDLEQNTACDNGSMMMVTVGLT